MEKQFVLVIFFNKWPIPSSFFYSLWFWQLSNLSRKGKKATSGQRETRGVSSSRLWGVIHVMLVAASAVACVTKWKKYHKEIGTALGITQPHVATKNA